MIMRFLFVLVIVSTVLFAVSCKQELEKKSPEFDNTQDLETDTASLTPQEAFSYSMMQEILGYSDPELETYLEEQIFPLVKNADKITFERISSSVFILTYFSEGIEKNLIIRKFYSPKTDEIFFEKSEINFDYKKQFFK